jgi:hypothetical protein
VLAANPDQLLFGKALWGAAPFLFHDECYVQVSGIELLKQNATHGDSDAKVNSGQQPADTTQKLRQSMRCEVLHHAESQLPSQSVASHRADRFVVQP